jgi:hypothetical protein
MPKQTEPFMLEIKNSRRNKTGSAVQAPSIWGKFAADLKQGPIDEQATPVHSTEHERAPEPRTAVTDRDEAVALPATSEFILKWEAKRAVKPKTGPTDAVTTFLTRIEQQKALLADYQSDPDGFSKLRSAWFRRIPEGFGVKIGYDSIDAGGGLRYVVVDTIQAVAEFLEDLIHHAQTDAGFQRALTETHMRRGARLRSGIKKEA